METLVDDKYYLLEDHYAGVDENGLFYGLPIDEDNESNLTNQRVSDWITQLKEEIKWNPDDTIKDA